MTVNIETVYRYDVKVESPNWPKGRTVRKSDKDMGGSIQGCSFHTYVCQISDGIDYI